MGDHKLGLLLRTAKTVVANFRPLRGEDEKLRKVGHREFVGGAWNDLAELQFKFVVDHGLKPKHVFLDIACGALRGGRLFIPYLDVGNYLGIDKHGELIQAGITTEINEDVLKIKLPEFVVSDCFEFGRLSKRPDFCLAQSLFSHLNKSDIRLCLARLADHSEPGCRFFATFFETPFPIPQFARSHSNRRFSYTRNEMESFGAQSGWKPHYIGNWNHPTQMMIEYERA